MEDGNITATHGVIPQLLRSLIFEKKSGHVGLAAKTSAGIALEKYTITSPDSSSEILGDDGNGVIVNNLISLMFKNGAEVVTVVPVESESDYFTGIFLASAERSVVCYIRHGVGAGRRFARGAFDASMPNRRSTAV